MCFFFHSLFLLLCPALLWKFKRGWGNSRLNRHNSKSVWIRSTTNSDEERWKKYNEQTKRNTEEKREKTDRKILLAFMRTVDLRFHLRTESHTGINNEFCKAQKEKKKNIDVLCTPSVAYSWNKQQGMTVKKVFQAKSDHHHRCLHRLSILFSYRRVWLLCVWWRWRWCTACLHIYITKQSRIHAMFPHYIFRNENILL